MTPPCLPWSEPRTLKKPFSVLHSRIVTVERLTVTSVMTTWSATGLRDSQYSGLVATTWLTRWGGWDFSSSSDKLLLLLLLLLLCLLILLLLRPFRRGGEVSSVLDWLGAIVHVSCTVLVWLRLSDADGSGKRGEGQGFFTWNGAHSH